MVAIATVRVCHIYVCFDRARYVLLDSMFLPKRFTVSLLLVRRCTPGYVDERMN